MNRFQKYREIMERQDEYGYTDDQGRQQTRNPFAMYPDPQSIKNPTDQPNAVNPSSTATDRMTPDMQQSMMNKFLSSKGVELTTDYDARQLALTGAGMTPAVGAPADFAAFVDSLVNLKLGDAGMNLAAMVPGAGQAAGGIKLSAAAAPLLATIKRAPGRVDDAADLTKTRRAGRNYDSPTTPSASPRNPDAPGQQKMPGFGTSRMTPQDRARISRGTAEYDKLTDTKTLDAVLKDIFPAKPKPATQTALRMDPVKRAVTRAVPRVTPLVAPETAIAPETATSPAPSSTSTSTATSTTTSTSPAPSPQRTPVMPRTGQESDVEPTIRRDNQDMIPPDTKKDKKSRTGNTRLVSPRGFREGIMDINFGSQVAPILNENKKLSDLMDKMPKGKAATTGAILAAILGLSAAAGFGQRNRGGGGSGVSDVISTLGDASLIAGVGGLDKLKSLSGFDPKIMPKVAGIDAVTSR